MSGRAEIKNTQAIMPESAGQRRINERSARVRTAVPLRRDHPRDGVLQMRWGDVGCMDASDAAHQTMPFR